MKKGNKDILLSKSSLFNNMFFKNNKKSISIILLSTIISGCGGGSSISVNHAPEITGIPSSISMTELTKKEVTNIICQDPDKDSTTMSVLSSDSNLKVKYDSQTDKLELDTIFWNLADGVNKDVNVTLTCSDGDLNTTKKILVVVQDEINDKYMTYATNIANNVVSNTVLNGTITLNDPDGQLDSNYNFGLVDENNNTVYSGVIEDINADGNYTFSVDFSTLSLSAGNYTFKTEEINPVDGGENYQGPVVIEQNITLEAPNQAPTAQDISVNANEFNSASVDLSSHINDPDGDNLTIQILSAENIDTSDLEGITTNVDGKIVNISVTGGTGNVKVVYKVLDGNGGEDTAEIIFEDLNGE